MEEIKEIPNSWAPVQLGDLCIEKEGLRRGPFGSAIKKEFFVPDGYKVYEQSNAIYDDTNKGKYFIDEKKYQELINFKVLPGDLIVSCSGTLGRIAEIPNNAKPGVINQALLRIRLINEIISKKYFLYFFRSSQFQRKIFDQSQGTAMSNLIGIKDFKEIELSIPPLSEQHRIVAKIEELFSSLDKGIESLKLAQQQLKVYRQAVLKWAFEGKFTNNNDIKEGELPEGWKWLKLEDVSEIKRGKSKHRPRNAPSLYGGKYPFIQTGDIRNANGGTITTYSQTYSEFGLAQSRLWEKGTLCITIAANIGETAFLGFDGCFPDSIVGLISNEKLIIPKFTNYFLISIKKSLENSAPATAQKNINVEILEKIIIPLPSIVEQQAIVQEIEFRLSVCDKIEETIEQSLLQAESLRQSILKKAFEGKLVPQDPNDEPASVLLERIKAEREMNKPVAKTKSKRKDSVSTPNNTQLSINSLIAEEVKA